VGEKDKGGMDRMRTCNLHMGSINEEQIKCGTIWNKRVMQCGHCKEQDLRDRKNREGTSNDNQTKSDQMPRMRRN